VVDDGSGFSSDVGGSGGSVSSSLAGSGSCSVDSVDSAVCGASTGCESVCRVVEAVVDSLYVLEYVGSGAGRRRRGDGDDITVYAIIIVPAMIPVATYQRPGGERKASTSRRAAPPRTTNKAPRLPNTVIFIEYVKFA
jgi:hypothetical protein